MLITKVLGVLAGRDMLASQLVKWANEADVILAADAGADILLGIGVVPDWVIGDLDSIQSGTDCPNVIQIEDQNSTDCDKLLIKAIELGVNQITLACVEGDQLDHMLATLHSAARHPIHVQVALRTGVGRLLISGDRFGIETQLGRRVSLLPLADCEGVSLTGVEWPMVRASLSPLGSTSIGNRAISNQVVAEVVNGVAFLYVERLEDEEAVW